MIVDSSAILAILFRESEAEATSLRPQIRSRSVGWYFEALPSDRLSRPIRETTRPPAPRELVIEVAKQLNTSFRATLKHLRNLGFLAR